MSDPSHKPDENLREISHLFLSSIRDKAGNGAARPQRIPPGQGPALPNPNVSMDLTPEEFARMFGGGAMGDDVDAMESDASADRGPATIPPVVAIIGAHLNGRQFDRAKEYARHLAAAGQRIGLIEVDASEFRVMCFERFSGAEDGQADTETSYDPRRMTEVLEEMSWDVERWLLVLPQARVPEARGLLRNCPRWLLLSTCDHDGVISCYRTLKGLTDLWPAGPAAGKPTLSLALLDASDDEQAERISSKLVSVCQQFLSWPLEAEPNVRSSATRVAEHLVMCARPTRDKGQLASAPQWEIVADLIARSRESGERQAQAPSAVEPMHEGSEPTAATTTSANKRFVADVVVSAPTTTPMATPMPTSIPDDFKPVMRVVPMQSNDPTFSASETNNSGETDVIDLPGGDGAGGMSGDLAIVEAILRHCSNELVECPIAPPNCPRARLAVSRDRRIVMLAVSKQGLADLNSIGQAYKWLQENQNLIGMAVPQLAIDPQQPPHLSLLINQADSAADTLRPMLQGDHVTVKTYRKLRWGGKTGLLLEAA